MNKYFLPGIEDHLPLLVAHYLDFSQPSEFKGRVPAPPQNWLSST